MTMDKLSTEEGGNRHNEEEKEHLLLFFLDVVGHPLELLTDGLNFLQPYETVTPELIFDRHHLLLHFLLYRRLIAIDPPQILLPHFGYFMHLIQDHEPQVAHTQNERTNTSQAQYQLIMHATLNNSVFN